MEFSLNLAQGWSSYTPHRLSYSHYRSDDLFIPHSIIKFQHRKFSSPRVIKGSHSLGKQLHKHAKSSIFLHIDGSTITINKRQIASNLLLDRYPASGLSL